MVKINITLSLLGQQCEPCDENSECTFFYTINDETLPDQLSWKYDGKEIVSCSHDTKPTELECIAYQTYDQYIKTYTEIIEGKLTVYIVLLKRNRQDRFMTSEKNIELFAYYKNKPPKQLYTCNINIFSK